MLQSYSRIVHDNIHDFINKSIPIIYFVSNVEVLLRNIFDKCTFRALCE